MITYSNNGCWGIEGVDLTKLNDSKVYGALYKLHQYEKSGLQPEQVIEMDELYREKCEEVNRLNIQLNTSCKGHMPAHNMNFGQALMMLKEGKKVARRGWNGKGIYIKIHLSTADEECTQPYIVIVTNNLVTDNLDAPKGIVPWLASQTDMLAEDWEVV